MYWLTKTVTSLWGALTSVLLLSWFLWCLRYRLKPALGLTTILSATLIMGQGMKTVIKNQVQEPRPYMAWLEQHYDIHKRSACPMPRKTRNAFIDKEIKRHHMIPLWLRNYWCYETGFSFPSGHTIFATSWALLSIGLLWPRRHFISSVMLMVWANGVMISRMALGMHWPWDLVMGIFISWLVITISCWLIQTWIGTLPVPPQTKNIRNRS